MKNVFLYGHILLLLTLLYNFATVRTANDGKALKQYLEKIKTKRRPREPIPPRLWRRRRDADERE